MLACGDCHSEIKDYPHPKKNSKVECASCHADEAAAVPKSVHGELLGPEACSSCHGDPHEVQPVGNKAGQECKACHADEIKEFATSVHGRKRPDGESPIATCQSCHGLAHKIVAQGDPASPVAKRNLPTTCGSCHSNAAYLEQHLIPFARPVEAYRSSVHGRAVAA